MDKKPSANDNLWNALFRVRVDAKKQIEYHQSQIGGKPLSGWTQEKHDEYHEKYLKQAIAAVEYTQLRQMQINPD